MKVWDQNFENTNKIINKNKNKFNIKPIQNVSPHKFVNIKLNKNFDKEE